MSIEFFGVVFFLGAALFFYAIFGGADFGAGILELFLGRDKRREQRELIAQAIAPVWEANHVWLIIAVVILSTGFPEAFGLLSTYLHLPIIAALLGIVVRGTAFTFRHYDVSRKSDAFYTALFAVSSFWTPFFLGLTLGGAIGGQIQPEAPTFWSAYVSPWLAPFPGAVGVFVTALFSLVASVYLMGETPDADLRRRFHRKVRWATIATLSAGALVFWADGSGAALRENFKASPTSLVCVAMATLLWFPLRASLLRVERRGYARILAAALAFLVFTGWYVSHYPTLFRITEGGVVRSVTFAQVAAPSATLRALLGALLVGVVLILPSLGYLLWVYKRELPEHRAADSR